MSGAGLDARAGASPALLRPRYGGGWHGRSDAVSQANDGRHDFDFLHGDWTVHNRRLAERLHGFTDWQEFDARASCGAVLGGIGNVDDFRATFPDGQPFQGMSLRLFDPATGLWSI